MTGHGARENRETSGGLRSAAHTPTGRGAHQQVERGMVGVVHEAEPVDDRNGEARSAIGQKRMCKGSPDADIVGSEPDRNQQQDEPAFGLTMLAVEIAEKVQELHRVAVDRRGHGEMAP
jgi:hypothetical protein